MALGFEAEMMGEFSSSQALSATPVLLQLLLFCSIYLKFPSLYSTSHPKLCSHPRPFLNHEVPTTHPIPNPSSHPNPPPFPPSTQQTSHIEKALNQPPRSVLTAPKHRTPYHPTTRPFPTPISQEGSFSIPPFVGNR